jgi:hypothetical protein
LRQAIEDANATAGADQINFQAGLTGNIILQSALPAVGEALTINGPGAAALTVSRDPAAPTTFRILTFNANATVSGLTLSRGIASGVDRPARSGGAIFVNGGVSATVLNSVISDNLATGEGGGINVSISGNLTVRNTTISGNTAGVGSGNRSGGGIYFRRGGSLLMENSTVSGNSSVARGGGLYLYGGGETGTFTVRNSTISGNTSGSDGGGLVFYTYGTNNNHSLTVQNTTITANSAAVGGGFMRIGGPGTTFTGTATFDSTIVANNSAATSADFNGPATVNFSLIRDQTGAVITGTNNLAAGTDPLLGPLQNNGGPTATHAIPDTSPARDAGSNPVNLGTDQRGPGFPRQVGQTDMGAYEFLPPGTPTAAGTFADVTTPGATTYTMQINYADDVAINTATLGNSDIRVTGPNGFDQLATFDNFTGSGGSITANYSFTAPNGAFDGPDSGVYTVSVEPSQVADNAGNFVPAGIVGSFVVLLPQTFTVTTTADSGAGSLRDAITKANALPGTADTIAFSVTGTIDLMTALPTLSDALTITGPGPAALTVRRDPAATALFRIFTVGAPDAQVLTFSISGLTITGGRTGPNTGGGSGAGTANDGTGILMFNDTLTVENCVITGNSSGSEGGGISVASINSGGAGTLTIRNTTISGNTASGNPGTSFGGGGGGIYMPNGGTLLLENSTVSGNVSMLSQGGGMYLYGGAALMTATIRNSTITGNTAATNGGGAMFYTGGTNPAHTFLVQNTTITGNAAGSGTGGGIFQSGPVGTVTIQSTVIANNTNVAAPDAGGTATMDHSLVRDQTGFSFVDNGGNLAAGTNPLFDAAGLTNNGGPTQTIALQSGSPLINAGSNPASLLSDQRGFTPRVVGAAADIGAYEFGAAAPTAPPTVATLAVNGSGAQRSEVRSIVVTFSEVVNFAGGNANAAAAFTLSRVGGGGNVGLVASVATVGTQTVVTLTFNNTNPTVIDQQSILNGGAPSLADGVYRLAIADGAVSSAASGLALDGDGNGSAGGAYLSPLDTAGSGTGFFFGLYRLFGDATGNGVVDLLDLAVFRGTFNQNGPNPPNPAYLAFLDSDNNNTVDLLDLAQFRSRFNVNLF